MANIRSANSWYVDTSSSSGDSTSYISEKNLKLIGIIYSVDANTDVIDIFDKNSGSAGAGLQKLSLMAATPNDTKQHRLPLEGIVFPNGVWVTLTGAPKATLIFAQAAGN